MYFLHSFSSSVFLLFLFDVGNGGAFCCCLSAIVYSLSFILNPSDQVGAGTAQYALHGGGGLPAAYAQLTLFRRSPWLWLVVLIREQWILANQIMATGWSCIGCPLDAFLGRYSWHALPGEEAEEDPGHAGVTMSLGWPGNASTVALCFDSPV